MEIKWINHAGFLLESGDVRLVTDPWMEGAAFDDGWKLLTPTLFTYADFSDVTHIWFSHEHPDHFSPPNIKKIDPSVRANITVLYQTTDDKKVVKFCQNAGFKAVIELPPSTWYALNADIKVMNQNDKDGDSWLAIHAEGLRILNLNDVVSYQTDAELSGLNRLIGGVDVLFTQFSYANWVGNPADTAYRKACAADKLDIMAAQMRIFKPRYIVPFASYVWFCHEENYYVNDNANKIGTIHDWLSDKTSASIVMFPNDTWTIGAAYDSVKAVSRYNEAYQKIEQNPELSRSKPVELAELKAISANYVKNLAEKNGFAARLKLLNPAKIFLTDWQKTVNLSLKGMVETDEKVDNCDIAVSSAALAYCLKFDWGGGTLNVNARFEKPKNGHFSRIENYFYIATLNNMGQQYSVQRVLTNAVRRLRSKYL